MKPIGKLKGLTLESLEELQEEAEERREKIQSLPRTPSVSGSPRGLSRTSLGKYTASDKQRGQLLNDYYTILGEIDRLSLKPEMPHWLDNIDLLTPHAFMAGMKFEREQRQKNAAYARHEKTRQSKIFAAKRAAELFKKGSTARMGDAATDIAYKLGIKDVTDNDTRRIKGWLNEAEEKGLIIIPPEARKPGAPEK